MDKYLISTNATISDAIVKLNENSGVGVIVVDEDLQLKGTVTDGDIRRALIQGKNLETEVSKIMFMTPYAATKDDSFEKVLEVSIQRHIKVIPVVENGKVVDLFVFGSDEFEDVPVVLMAGGLGTRLGEHTKNCPKPMLKVGGRPVLERIIENFTKVGFNKFYISINYKAEMIEDYFGNGSNFNCKIEYLREKKRLGTAGSLSLLPEKITGPMVVMNGDLLTQVDFRRLISFHKQNGARVTMCTRLYDIQVPYGVVNIKNGFAQNMEEKPTHSFNVNAGVYVIDAKFISMIPNDEYYDMTSFVDDIMKEHKILCFPLVEKWIDIGKVSDLEYARDTYESSDD